MASAVAQRGWDRRLILWAAAAICFCVLVVPLAFVMLSSLRGPATYLPIEPEARWTLENFRDFYGDMSLYTRVLPDTLLLAIGSLALACSIAVVLAWRIERVPTRFRVAARILVLAPMTLPTTATAMAWITLLGPNAGWINVAFRAITGSTKESGPFNVFSMGGLIWCQGMAAVPVAYLLLSPGIRALRKDAEEAGYVAGARPSGVLWHIHLPSAIQSCLGPLLIMFLVALEQVDFPYILGPTAGIQVLGTRMLHELASTSGLPDYGGTSAAAVLMLAFAVAGLGVHDALTRNRPAGTASARVAENVNGRRGSWTTASTILLVGYVLAAFAVPVGVLVLQSLGTGAEGVDWAFARLVTDARFGRAALNTVVVAVSSAVIGTMVGLVVAVLAARRSNGIGRLLDRLSMSSIALPPVVVAFGLSVVFLSVPVGIYGTIFMLVIAYSYRVALSTRLIGGALSRIGSSLEEAAATSGIGWLRTQVSIIAPLVWPSILASVAFLFIVGVKEFTIPLMLYSPDNVVLPVLVLQLTQAGNPAAGAFCGLVVMAMGLLGIAALAMADRALERGSTLS